VDIRFYPVGSAVLDEGLSPRAAVAIGIPILAISLPTRAVTSNGTSATASLQQAAACSLAWRPDLGEVDFGGPLVAKI